MPEIVLLGSVHKETGKCNSMELARILEFIKPDVLFQEIPYFDFLEINTVGSKSILEIKAISEYLKLHLVQQIPVDTLGRSSQEHAKLDQVMDRVLHVGPDLMRVLDQQEYLQCNKGFQYLNSRLSDRMLRQTDFLITNALQKLNDPSLSLTYTEWKTYNSKREDVMITNVYEYCRLNQFNKGLLLFGSAHREGLISKIQKIKRRQSIRVNWKLDCGMKN